VRTASLTIRNIPKPVLDRLKVRAARHRRSMQGEILDILEMASLEPETRLTGAAALARVRALGLVTPGDSVAMIREDRDRGGG
jgi:plasmid stability protein